VEQWAKLLSAIHLPPPEVRVAGNALFDPAAEFRMSNAPVRDSGSIGIAERTGHGRPGLVRPTALHPGGIGTARRML